ncbi:MAG: FAD-binding protein, partial [Eubacteriales bacterium]
TSSSGYHLSVSLIENQEVLTALGTVRVSALVPESMIIKKRETINKVVAVGFKGYGDFYPQMFLDNLEERLFPDAEKIIKIIDLDVKGNLKPNSLALLLSREEILKKVIDELKPLSTHKNTVQGGTSEGDTLFVFPAVLGENPNNDIWMKLTNSLDGQVIEVPGLPPSIPGLRLEKALTVFLRRKGAEFRHNSRVVGFNAEKERITSIIALDSSNTEHNIEANNFILATGSFWGGGLVAHKENLIEPVFNLPVFSQKKDNDTPLLSLQGQPFLSTGLETDNCLRPNPGFTNLYAAGSILAHSNYSSEKSGLGLALATGYKIGSLV